jgi:hypothetical protein
MHACWHHHTCCLLLLRAAVKGAGQMRLGPAACTELRLARDACCMHDMLFGCQCTSTGLDSGAEGMARVGSDTLNSSENVTNDRHTHSIDIITDEFLFLQISVVPT